MCIDSFCFDQPAGAADRCLDCSVEATCPYSARKIYLDRVKQVNTSTHYLHQFSFEFDHRLKIVFCVCVCVCWCVRVTPAGLYQSYVRARSQTSSQSPRHWGLDRMAAVSTSVTMMSAVIRLENSGAVTVLGWESKVRLSLGLNLYGTAYYHFLTLKLLFLLKST